MIVLGIHTGHDGSACVVKEGRLVCALSYERIYRCENNWRHKKAHGVSDQLLDYVLAGAGVTLDQVDVIALSDWNIKYANGTMTVRKRDDCTYPRDTPVEECTWNCIFGDDVLRFDAEIRGRKLPAFNVGHHMSHCAAAFYTSPFESAMCFSMDSSGGDVRSNSLIAGGLGNRISAGKCPGAMIGLVYGNVCERLGLGSQMFKAGAMMGLAAYGKPQDISTLINGSLIPGGDYHPYVDVVWNHLFGKSFQFDWCCGVPQDNYKVQADIAASMQLLFEDSVLKLVNGLAAGPLCLGGGSFLNCSVNSRIVRETGRKVHLFPACSDDGCAAGAALYVAHHMNNEPRAKYTDADLAYLGPEPPAPAWQQDILRLAPDKIEFSRDVDVEHVATAIAAGKVVGWFQGRMEFGPRALGGRSILADPRSPTMRDHLNQSVKKREWFRPFAPSVLAEESDKWFDFPGASPFMLMTAKVNPATWISAESKWLLPAITHVDGSSRMQTVTREMNPAYYELISAFRDLTGVPMLLNTSFNGPGHPMVEDEASVREAWDTMPLDLCVYNGEVWER